MGCTTSPLAATSPDSHEGLLRCCLFDSWLAAEIGAVLTETQRWHDRQRRLPADLMLSLMVTMGAARRLSVPSLLMHAGDYLGKPRAAWVTEEAFYHARHRLGVEPTRALFERLAARVQPSPCFLGLRPYGIDGTTLTVPDTPANAAEFGRPGVAEGQAAFPVVSVITLVDTTARQIRDAEIGPYKASERQACVRLVSHLSSDSVVFFDAGITAGWLLHHLKSERTHFVARASENWDPRVVRSLGPGDSIVEVDVWESIPRPKDDTRRDKRRLLGVLRLRMIEYSVAGCPRIRLFTDLVDPIQYPALEIALGYHRRWECELVTDEIKTHQLTPAKGTVPTCLRSKTPMGVRQEAYAALTAYNIIRMMIDTAAQAGGVDPLEISFVRATEAIKLALPKLKNAPPRARPALTARLLLDLLSCRIDRPRRRRQWPRVVKKRATHFPAKKRHHRERRLGDVQLAIGLLVQAGDP